MLSDIKKSIVLIMVVIYLAHISVKTSVDLLVISLRNVIVMLIQMKKIAPDFYDHLPQYTSWCKVLWDFVFDPAIGPYARVRREIDVHGKISVHEAKSNVENGVKNHEVASNGHMSNGHSKLN